MANDVHSVIVIRSCLELYSEKSLLGKSNMSEDAPVTDDGDNKRQQHADSDKEDRVVVCCGAVPQTFLSLSVEPVRRPPKVIR